MYVLWLDGSERHYLLSLLKKQRASRAIQLAAQLRAAVDVFGVVMWSDGDIASMLREQGVPDTPDNVLAVRDSYYGRHMQDHMIEHGWTLLEDAVSGLNR